MLQLFRGLLATTVALLGLATRAKCNPERRLSTRDFSGSDLLNYHGAVLVKNGIETSCEIALIDNQSAFVAASCIEMTNGAVDTSVQHDVYFDQYGNNSPANTPVASSDIHIHPSYDRNTLANNIAIIEFDFTDQGNWTNSIAVYPTEWTDTLFVRRELIEASSSTWGDIDLKSNTVDPSTCSMYSAIFGDNGNDMRCNSIQVNSVWNAECPLPYGSLYGEVANTSLAIGGLHSYTFMPTSDYCNGDRGLYYFTMLYDYVEWAESIIGRNISVLVGDTSAYDATSKSVSFSMNDTSAFNPDNWYLFSSNVRFPALWNPADADSEYLSSSGSISSGGGDAEDGSLAGGTSSVEGMTDAGAAYTGLSKNATIAIAVSVPVGVIILATIAFFVYKRRHRREGHIPGRWRRSRIKSQADVDELVEQLGGAEEHDTLPTYREIHDSVRVSNCAAGALYPLSPDAATFEKTG